MESPDQREKFEKAIKAGSLCGDFAAAVLGANPLGGFHSHIVDCFVTAWCVIEDHVKEKEKVQNDDLPAKEILKRLKVREGSMAEGADGLSFETHIHAEAVLHEAIRLLEREN